MTVTSVLGYSANVQERLAFSFCRTRLITKDTKALLAEKILKLLIHMTRE